MIRKDIVAKIERDLEFLDCKPEAIFVINKEYCVIYSKKHRKHFRFAILRAPNSRLLLTEMHGCKETIHAFIEVEALYEQWLRTQRYSVRSLKNATRSVTDEWGKFEDTKTLFISDKIKTLIGGV